MLLLTTTSEVIRLITDSLAPIDVHASWVDRSGTMETPGSTNTAINGAAVTTVVAAPAASTARNVRRLSIRNRSGATSCTVVTQIYDGSTSYQIDERVLGPGQSILLYDDGSFLPASTGGPQTRPWYGVVAFAQGDGDPGRGLAWVQNGPTVAATPTNIGTSVARCCSFMLPFDMTVNRIRAYGVGATTSVYRVAIYRMSDLARLTAELAFTTASSTWVSIGSALNVSLAKDTLYFIACAVNATGTTPGVACMGTTVAATTGQINTIPASLPGSLAQGATNYASGNLFQFAVSTGALPNPAATLAAQATWTGGMPAFWLDSADT